MSPAQFRTDSGTPVPGASSQQLAQIRAALHSDYGVLPCQIAEAASYSMAMVVRYALGLSAAGGEVCGLITDSLSGWIALATLRHLATSGARPVAVLIGDGGSDDLERQLIPLLKMGVAVSRVDNPGDIELLNDIVAQSHNVLCGLYQPGLGLGSDLKRIVDILNELSTPIHAIELPLGVDPDSGKVLAGPLFASSTLSIGLPLNGLFAGREYAGRHYLCDSSLPEQLLSEHALQMPILFAEQPVIRIHAAVTEES